MTFTDWLRQVKDSLKERYSDQYDDFEFIDEESYDILRRYFEANREPKSISLEELISPASEFQQVCRQTGAVRQSLWEKT